MYESPIDKIYKDIQTQMIQQDEEMVMKAVREVGITVNKDELVKALQYDRNQYEKGYQDGLQVGIEKGKQEAFDEIKKHLSLGNLSVTQPYDR